MELLVEHSLLEAHFLPYRQKIIGNGVAFSTPYGVHEVLYADWTASGRLYAPIEERLNNDIGAFVANTHTETSHTGTLMTHAYHEAREIIKHHVGADRNDVLLMVGSGMTAAINKWQRILGLRVPEQYQSKVILPKEQRPVVFVTHMEHHSNQTTWIETIAEVVVIEPNQEGLVCLENLKQLLESYKNRPLKIAAITACSNITGIQTPYHDIARIMHENDGFCFVDFACSAPYVDINMHPADPMQRLDAIYFSPHKFLGGPGTPGVLIFNKDLYTLKIPDQPGGGTVRWTNPWGEHSYYDDIEAREDGGTPPFLQTIKTALCVKLKEEMGVQNILAREEELLDLFLPRFRTIKGLYMLADNQPHRLSIISFYVKNLHYNLGVKLLNDRFGIQARGGCSCAGTYGHYLLNVSPEHSHSITDKINAGDLSEKPGWIRISLHPTMTNDEAHFLLNAIEQVAENFQEWSQDYHYDAQTNEFEPKQKDLSIHKTVKAWFEL